MKPEPGTDPHEPTILGPPDHREDFPRQLRIRKPAEFDHVFQQRQRATDEVLTVFVATNQRQVTRLGLSVSRKVGHAVVRNRWKRRLRETFRRHRDELPIGLDIVVIPRVSQPPEQESLFGRLVRLVRRAARKSPS